MKITTFKAFKSRNYKLYFGGQSISLMGTWMQRTAVYWIVYVQTHSPFILGVTVFAVQFPSFLLGLFGGMVADKYNRYRVLVFTQIASMLQAFALATIVVFTQYTIIEILGLSVILGAINAFDVPARQSLVHYMVEDKEHLGNAIALNSSMVNLARLIGPAVAGIILDTFGAGTCFYINAVSFIAVLASLFMMRLPEFLPQARVQKMRENLKEGFVYVKENSSINTLIILLALISFFVLPAVTLLPVLVKEALKGTAATYGYLNSFIGIGALCATILIASFSANRNNSKLLMTGMGVTSVGLLAFSQAHLPLAFFFATLMGFGMMLFVTITNTILQMTSSIEMRGRVISYFAMAFFGMQPLGALLVGSVAHYIGAQNTIFLEGIIAVVLLLVFNMKLRRYLPETFESV